MQTPEILQTYITENDNRREIGEPLIFSNGDSLLALVQVANETGKSII